jgi:kynurenine formamidase
VWPGREPAVHTIEQDGASYAAGAAQELAGGFRSAVDAISTGLHGTTHCDALGHAWIGDQAWNGVDATAAGPLARASIEPIARRGVVGRGVLLDVARHLGTDALAPGEALGADVLDACAAAQGTALRPGDALILRTGWIARYYRDGAESFYRDFREPGLTHSRELAEWFDEHRVASLVTDTFGNEVGAERETGLYGPVHIALLMRLGIVFTELAWLEDLAADCARDGRYAFLYVCAPLRVVGGTAGPANPIVVK